MMVSLLKSLTMLDWCGLIRDWGGLPNDEVACAEASCKAADDELHSTTDGSVLCTERDDAGRTSDM